MIINSRDDLDVLKDTPAYLDALRALAGSMVMSMDMAVYPEGHSQPDYTGPTVEPDWHEVETLDVIERLGFTRATFAAEYAAAKDGTAP